MRIRHDSTPNPCASSLARSANSFGDCPDTRRTVTRSAHGPACDLAQHRQGDPAPVHGGEPGDGHDGLPAAPVTPPPPPRLRRDRDEAGVPVRPGQPQRHQRRDGDVGQDHDARPACLRPRRDHDPGGHVEQRVADQEPDHPDQQADELDEPDDPFGGAVHRGPPDRGGERVGVVYLGVLLARDMVAHTLVTSFPCQASEGRDQGRPEGASFRPSRPVLITPQLARSCRPAGARSAARSPPRTRRPGRPAAARSPRHRR